MPRRRSGKSPEAPRGDPQVSAKGSLELLQRVIAEAEGTLTDARPRTWDDVQSWRTFSRPLLYRALGDNHPDANRIVDAATSGMIGRVNPSPRQVDHDARKALHSGIRTATAVLKAQELLAADTSPSTDTAAPPHAAAAEPRLFLVHGRDAGARQTVTRFLERLIGEERVTILEEQPGALATLMEKFELYATAATFAVVLLTPDDEGRLRGNGELWPRPRQNVVLELGYFIGRLGRERVVALRPEEDAEWPSDASGVQYVLFGEGRDWRSLLARELKSAGFEINHNALL